MNKMSIIFRYHLDRFWLLKDGGQISNHEGAIKHTSAWSTSTVTTPYNNILGYGACITNCKYCPFVEHLRKRKKNIITHEGITMLFEYMAPSYGRSDMFYSCIFGGGGTEGSYLSSLSVGTINAYGERDDGCHHLRRKIVLFIYGKR